MKLFNYEEFTTHYNQSKNEKILLDVRTPEEIAAGALKGATIIPVQELEDRANELSKNADIFIYCRSGMRAQTAAAILKHEGFSNLFVAANCGYEQLKNQL